MAVRLNFWLRLGVAFWAVHTLAAPVSPDADLWRIEPPQVIDPSGLARRLSLGGDPASDFFRFACSPETRLLLNRHTAGEPPAPELIAAILADLNRALDNPRLYAEGPWDKIPLGPRTQALLTAEDPEALDPREVNRRLLEDAFSNELETAWPEPCYLRARDVLKPGELAETLRRGDDALSAHLRDNLPPDTRLRLEAYAGPAEPPADLQQGLLEFLNDVIRRQDLYEPGRFAHADLGKPTRELIAQAPAGAARSRLNRLLLEDAYPGLLRRLAPEPIDIQADSLEYDRATDLMVAAGRVRVRQGDETLRCSHAIINMASLDVLAEGSVIFERGSDTWVGEALRYNFLSHQGDFGVFDAYLEPFYTRAKASQRVGPDRFELRSARLSPCEGDPPEAWFRARKVWITPGRHVRGRHVVMFVHGVPVMYSPFWNQNIGDRNFMSFAPGYNSRMSAYLLTAFSYRLSRKVEAATHVDLRARRGLGLGQDILWSASGNATELSTERYMDRDDDDFWSFSSWSSRDRSDDEKEEDKWAGDLIAYGIQDRWPDEGEAQAYPLDHERYRVRLYHNQSFTDRDYFMGQINYLSDPKIIEQFFRREYKSSPEPDNYLVFGHRAERLSLSLSAERRLNDFYTAVDRLPELTLDFRRQRIGQSPFFYQGETVGGYLEKNWESNLTNASDYAAGRLHTEHRLYYPTKQAGFLNLIPRVGWRGTAYSATKEDVTNVVTTIVVGTNGVLRTNTASRVTAREMDAEFRSYPELGLETSFKAFKVWQTHPGDIINNVRHIVEPYADYTLAPEPNVTPDRLYDFDAIDTLDRLNQVQLGLRNKIQTQRFGRLPSRPHTVADLINADVWIIYRLDPRENENTFSNVCWDVRSTPFPWMELKVDGAYDPYTNQVETLNTRLSLNDRTLWRYYIEHRFARDDNSLLNSALTLTPFAAWEYSAFVRHQLETSTLEAWGLSVQRRRECLTYKVGCEFEDDDYSFWVKFWFSQFPKVRLDVGL